MMSKAPGQGKLGMEDISSAKIRAASLLRETYRYFFSSCHNEMGISEPQQRRVQRFYCPGFFFRRMQSYGNL